MISHVKTPDTIIKLDLPLNESRNLQTQDFQFTPFEDVLRPRPFCFLICFLNPSKGVARITFIWSAVQVNLNTGFETGHSWWTFQRTPTLRIEIRWNIRCALALRVTETLWSLLQIIKMLSYAKGLEWPTDFVLLLLVLRIKMVISFPGGSLITITLRTNPKGRAAIRNVTQTDPMKIRSIFIAVLQ